MAISAQQAWGNPASQRLAGSIARHYLPKTTRQIGGKAVTSFAPGFKPIGGIKGGLVGIGTEYLGSRLKPKEDQPIMGGEFGSITDAYKRRLEGAGPGILGGMVRGAGQGAQFGGPWGALGGTIAGGVIGAATKNATTAYSDFLPNDAREIIAKAHREYLGREADPAYIDAWMKGQGWKPGDKGVGQKHVFEQLAMLKNSPEAMQHRGQINTAPSQMQSTWRPGPISIPSYFQNTPENVELAARINRRSGFNA